MTDAAFTTMGSSRSDSPADDPHASPPSSAPVVTSRTMEAVVYVMLLALAMILAYDNLRSGAGWARDGPQSGYLPFYLCVILGGASLYGLARLLVTRAEAPRTFVTREQLWRVLQVFAPTLVFCVLMQWLGIYVASFLLIAGFMRFVGRIAWWKSLLTGFAFAAVMFGTFEIAFDVLMPKGPLEAAFGF